MKGIKLSLLAALLVSSSAFAVENTKVSGDAKLYYATNDSVDLFDQASSAGQAAVNLGLTTDLSDSVKAGVKVSVLNTLGLENTLVSNIWEGNTQTAWWMSEAWLATNVMDTDVKVGRQTLDTPFVFSENRSIAQNTFDAAVLANKSFSGTTLVAAYAGQTNAGGTGYGSVVNPGLAQTDGFATDLGAYVFGVANESMEGVAVQAWYYNLDSADAAWLQADVDMSGLTLGAQYAILNGDAAAESNAFGVKVGYAMGDLDLSAAYSSADEDGASGAIQNLTGFGQSKLYTDAAWMHGYVGRAGTDALKVAAKYDMKDVAKLGACYTDASSDTTANEMTEIAVSASRSYGKLDTTLLVVNSEVGNADDVNTVHVYLTYNF